MQYWKSICWVDILCWCKKNVKTVSLTCHIILQTEHKIMLTQDIVPGSYTFFALWLSYFTAQIDYTNFYKTVLSFPDIPIGLLNEN